MRIFNVLVNIDGIGSVDVQAETEEEAISKAESLELHELSIDSFSIMAFNATDETDEH